MGGAFLGCAGFKLMKLPIVFTSLSLYTVSLDACYYAARIAYPALLYNRAVDNERSFRDFGLRNLFLTWRRYITSSSLFKSLKISTLVTLVTLVREYLLTLISSFFFIFLFFFFTFITSFIFLAILVLLLHYVLSLLPLSLTLSRVTFP